MSGKTYYLEASDHNEVGVQMKRIEAFQPAQKALFSGLLGTYAARSDRNVTLIQLKEMVDDTEGLSKIETIAAKVDNACLILSSSTCETKMRYHSKAFSPYPLVIQSNNGEFSKDWNAGNTQPLGVANILKCITDLTLEQRKALTIKLGKLDSPLTNQTITDALKEA